MRYVEQPLGGFEQFMVGLNQSATVRIAQSYGLHLPSWMAELPRAMPELQLLRNARAGRPNVYAYCFCAPR